MPAVAEGNGGLQSADVSKFLVWATGLRLVPSPEIETAGGGEDVIANFGAYFWT